jgi:DNA polymerase-3 subunit beta
MKVVCEQEKLLTSLKAVGQAVGRHGVLSILDHVLLTAGEGQLRVSATDLEIAVVCQVEAQVEREGAVAVPWRGLYDLVKTLAPGRMMLERHKDKKGKVEVTWEGGRAGFYCKDVEEFPSLPTLDDFEHQIGLEANALKRAIQRVVLAAAPDDLDRPILTGVLFEVEAEGRQLTLVAADGVRLSADTLELSDEAGFTKAIVPARALASLARLVDDGAETVTFGCSDHQAIFVMPGATVMAQLIDGLFPDWHAIVPDPLPEEVTQVTVKREAMLQACYAARVIAREAFNKVELRIEPPDELVVKASDIVFGEEAISVEARVEGARLGIAFDVKYLLDVLRAVEEEWVRFEFTWPTSPGALYLPETPGFVHLIMPMHMSGEATVGP